MINIGGSFCSLALILDVLAATYFWVEILILNIRIFTDISVESLVETGYAVFITTYLISSFKNTGLTGRHPGYFMGTHNRPNQGDYN